ncbi:UDP-N-acetylmuramoylalanine--D-glutamate ligase [Trichinella spiralis]|uniref:UDP-N-acetylmuramoylalanine--D-glutamate ligase n=1 Tax=Trichinella spiralis TaxID=6334 RepID=A0ABR3K739_TRISP
MRKTVNAEKFQFFVRCRAKLIPISGQLLQTNAIDIARKMGIKQWLAGIIYASPYNMKFCTISEETADQTLIEELLSKSNANKDVLSVKVEDPLKEKLTYSEAITIKDIRFKSTLI